MSDCCLNDYDKFIGKYITVIYDCGSKYKKLHCELFEYCEKNSNEKFIILKAHNNMIYHINCNKIIYWIAEYEDMLTENQDNYKSNTKPIESNAVAESEDLLLEKTLDKETIPLETSIPNIQLQDEELSQAAEIIDSCSVNLTKENTSLAPNEYTTYDELQENSNILSKSENKFDTSLEPVSNAAIISDEHEISHDKTITDYKKDHGCDKSLEKYNHKDTYKKNVLRFPLAAFINCNFQGVYLTIYTTSTQAISGEVIFNYDYLIVLKSDAKTYYINPEQITYFC
ncbi:hypothetical protein [Clostridium pasteurianum]|uniref:Uncharacterized protein n=1 Tax=Clostridium pasteurianum BC1 TaxID=86416 RepID=R4KD09_CLOPA|nr:hypothetical protein [Clostridium pasteurianum]AGK98434.1 hypothetical protein Clopa_3652 [Clostridium pasteurianum BC1]